jgi:DNA-binding NtrC family response regulator
MKIFGRPPIPIEKSDVLSALLATRGNIVDAAGRLGCSWRTLYRRIDDLGLTTELEKIRAQWCPTCHRALS